MESVHIFWTFKFKFSFVFYILVFSFNKTIISLALVEYEMNTAYHLISNVRLWNSC